MPFGVVSGRGMGVLDGVVVVEGEGAVLGLNLGSPIVTNGGFAMRLFPTVLVNVVNVLCFLERFCYKNVTTRNPNWGPADGLAQKIAVKRK